MQWSVTAVTLPTPQTPAPRGMTPRVSFCNFIRLHSATVAGVIYFLPIAGIYVLYISGGISP